MGLSVLEAANAGIKYLNPDSKPGLLFTLLSLFRVLTSCDLALTSQELSFLFTPFDLKRLESYAQNLLDYHIILDLLPTVATLYFEKRLGEGVRLSAIQSSLLLGMGLQRKSVEAVEVSLHSILSGFM
jgi:N-acetyltransferase 10